jgi:hypothetical protein
MKNFKLFLLLLVLSVAVLSCDKDDDDDASVSGKKYESTYLKVETTGSFEESFEYKTKSELVENDMYSVIEFKSDGKFYSDNELEGTWTQSGSNVTVSSEGENISGTIKGNVITFTISESEDAGTYKMTYQFTKM